MCDTARIISEYAKDPGFDKAKVADELDIQVKSLERILNPYDPYDLGTRKLIGFIRATGNFTLLDHIEARLGRAAFSVATAGNFSLNLDGMCKFVKEAGHAMNALSDALVDGKVTKAEAVECRREIMHLVQVSFGLLSKLDEIEKR